MSRIGVKNTKPEVQLRKALWHAGHRGYRLHAKHLPGRPDIVFGPGKLAIFVNGCFWHRCPHCSPGLPKSNTEFWKQKFRTNVQRDHQKASDLVTRGWRVLTIWECETRRDLDRCVLQVVEMLGQQTGRRA